MFHNQSDRRLGMIEFVATLGGILGIIVSLQLDLLPPLARVLYSANIVLFIIFAFLAYSAVLIPTDKKRIQELISYLSAAFSALLTVPLTVAFSSTSAGLVIQSFPYIGILVAIVVYIGAIF